MSSSLSGKFVLRMTPELHKKLKAEAIKRGLSLNQWILSHLESDPAADSGSKSLLSKVQKEWEPLGVMQFGSTVRGEDRVDSDIDWLIVLPSSVRLNRSLYRRLDELIAQTADSETLSGHFVHLPENLGNLSSLWLEVALEGQWVYCRSNRLKNIIAQIKQKIASGEYIRKTSHGHPYWVYATASEVKDAK